MSFFLGRYFGNRKNFWFISAELLKIPQDFRFILKVLDEFLDSIEFLLLKFFLKKRLGMPGGGGGGNMGGGFGGGFNFGAGGKNCLKMMS